MEKGINVVSYFDGMSVGQMALRDLEIGVKNFNAFEIDKYAIEVTNNNFPLTIQNGSVVGAKLDLLPPTDLLIGGSPCQSFSVAGDGSGFEGKSGLFWEFVRAKEELNPTFFMLENVVMKKEWEQVISDALGVTPIQLNSADFGAQNRRRLFWTNIPVDEVNFTSDKTIGDILVPGPSTKVVKDTARNLRHERSFNQKSLTCTATMYKGAGNNGMSLVRRLPQKELSVLSVTEVERLMNVPEGCTEGVSNSQRLKMLGNGWDLAVIKHIFRNLKQ